jgi:hypothetical protein
LGLIPDEGRGVAFAVVLLLACIQILAKTLATVLLFITNPSWLWFYFAGDYGLYIVYKIARGDYVNHNPGPYVASLIVGPINMITVKATLDFTGCLAMRLPLLMGGSYFTFNLAATQAAVLMSAHLYNEHAEDAQLSATVTRLVAGVLVGAWLFTFTYFVLCVATESHRSTLWSTTSERKCVLAYFLEGETDEDKMLIFQCNDILWENELGKSVKEFTLANWAVWKKEHPAWFTPLLISMVKDEYIPAEFLPGLGGANRPRRGSSAGSLGSLRFMSVREKPTAVREEARSVREMAEEEEAKDDETAEN